MEKPGRNNGGKTLEYQLEDRCLVLNGYCLRLSVTEAIIVNCLLERINELVLINDLLEQIPELQGMTSKAFRQHLGRMNRAADVLFKGPLFGTVGIGPDAQVVMITAYNLILNRVYA